MCKTPEQEQYSSGRTWYHVQMDWGLHLLPTPLLSAPTHNKLGRHPPISVPQKKKKKKKKEEDLKTNTITWIHQWSEVTAKTATKIYQNLCVCVLSHFSCVWLYVTLWTVALQVPLSMGLENGQEYWSGLPCSPSGDLLDPTSVSWISCIAAGSWPLETDKSRVIVRICFPGTEAPRPLWGPGTLKGPFDELPVVYLDSMEENYSGGGGGA